MLKTIKEIRTILHDSVAVAERQLAKAKTSAERKSPIRNIQAYKFGLERISGLPSDVKVFVRANQTSGINIGDLTEVAVKYYLTPNKENVYKVSPKNAHDITRNTMNEVKAWASVNRTPNNLTEPHGFYAVLHTGAYYIPKAVVEKYWNRFSSVGNAKRISRKQMVDIITIENIKQNLGLTEALGF